MVRSFDARPEDIDSEDLLEMEQLKMDLKSAE